MKQVTLWASALVLLTASAIATKAFASLGNKDPQPLTTELHWSICEPNVAAIAQKLQLNWQVDKARTVRYYDHGDLSLFQRGVIWRVRATATKSKSTLKLRGIAESQIDWNWLAGRDFKCEWDQFGLAKTLSCAVDATIRKSGAKTVRIADQLSREQKEFLRRMGPPQINTTGALSHGPFANTSYSAQNPIAGQLLDLDSVTVGGNQEFLEIATRVDTMGSDTLMAQISAEFQKAGLILCPTQSGLTEKILKSH